ARIAASSPESTKLIAPRIRAAMARPGGLFERIGAGRAICRCRSARDAAIAALLFRLVERLVGARVDRRRRVAGPELGEPAGDRDVLGLAFVLERRRLDREAQLRRDRD